MFHAPQAETWQKGTKLNRKAINLIAAAERNDGYADVPPGTIDDEIECELALYGYAVAHRNRRSSIHPST